MQSQQQKTTGILKVVKPRKLSKKIIIAEPVQEEKKDETLEELKEEFEMNECGASENKYDKKCNKFLLKRELLERKELLRHPE